MDHNKKHTNLSCLPEPAFRWMGPRVGRLNISSDYFFYFFVDRTKTFSDSTISANFEQSTRIESSQADENNTLKTKLKLCLRPKDCGPSIAITKLRQKLSNF